MSIHKAIKSLQLQYKFYQPVWELWRVKGIHSLTPQQICTIETHRKNNFALPNIMRVKEIDVSEENINEITKILKADRNHFRKWVVSQFQFDIMRLAKQRGWDIFYETPINKLNVSDELKHGLRLFCVNTLNEFFEVQTDKTLKAKNYFNKTLKLFAITQKEGKAINNQKKEVG